MDWVDRSLGEQPRFPPAVRLKVALSGHLGRLEEGRRWLNAGALPQADGCPLWRLCAHLLLARTTGGLHRRFAQGAITRGMTATRKLAAILAADIVGYSRLMGRDEAGTAQALREHRAAADPLIAERGGRIVKTTGDGVLIEFGSVVGAVQCAIDLQRLMTERYGRISDERRMDLRIGVHLGDVLVASH